MHSSRMKYKVQKPFLKWVGGKSQILDLILSKIPQEMNNYHEIFVGGGSVLFGVLSLQKQSKLTIHHKIYAYDINPTLIQVYQHIQQHPTQLYEKLQYYMNQYDELTGNVIIRNPKTLTEAITSKESYYYWLRGQFNAWLKSNTNTSTSTHTSTTTHSPHTSTSTSTTTPLEISALFMFLNKTCFRGMYREGPNGFNVPYGHYKKTPAIMTREEFVNISEFIQHVTFIHRDFRESIPTVQEGDFVYMDPPYVPVDNQKTSFVGYNVNGFNTDMHTTLFDMIHELSTRNVKFIMSNSHTEFVVDTFKEYEIEEIIVRRAIHSKNPSIKTGEVLVIRV